MSGEDTVLHCETPGCNQTTTWGKILDDPVGQILCDSCKKPKPNHIECKYIVSGRQKHLLSCPKRMSKGIGRMNDGECNCDDGSEGCRFGGSITHAANCENPHEPH